MELRDLRTFVAVAQQRSFSRAAAALHVSQPALSEQVRKLEDELGVTLFERTSRGVVLTDAGEALLPQARAVLAQADVALEAVRMVSHGVAGTLTLGFIDSAALGIVPPLVRAFSARYPHVKLRLRELGTRAQLRAIEDGEIDVGIMRGPVWNPGLVGERLRNEALVVALPAEHRLARGATVQLVDLRNEGFITHPPDRGAALYEETMRLCHEAGFDPTIVQEANEIATMCALVDAGLGVAIVPSSAVVITPSGLVYRPLDPHAELERWAVWREGAQTAVVRAFVDVVTSENGEVRGAVGDGGPSS